VQKDFDQQRLRHDRLQASRPPSAAAVEPSVVAPAPLIATKDTPEHHLLVLILHFESVGSPLSRTLPHDWIDLSHSAGVLLNRFLAEFEQDAWPGRDHLEGLIESEAERTLVASLLFESPQIDDPVKVGNEALRLIQARALDPRVRQIELALAKGSADSNFDANYLFKELLDIKRQLRAPLRLPAY
jgi:DNA primase